MLRVVLPDKTEEEFQGILEALMSERPTVVLNGKTVTINYSVGFVRAAMDEEDKLFTLCVDADELMYQAKQRAHAGR